MNFTKQKSDKVAQDLLGMKVEIGGRGPGVTDCYGVLIRYFREFDIQLPDYSYKDDWSRDSDIYLKEYATCFRKLDRDEKLEIGDVILFHSRENPSHAGVYLGEGKFVHAFDAKTGTRIDSLITNPKWKENVYGYFRIKGGDKE